MLALYFLSLEMIVQVGILPLENSHHLVYFDFETIKFASIHIGVMIAHKMLENGVNFYTKLGFKTTNTFALNARDMSWLKSKLTEYSCSYGALGDYAGFYVANCLDGNGAVTARHYDTENQNDGLDGIAFNHILSHEYFHQMQDEY